MGAVVTKPHYGYELRHEIEPTEIDVLVDGLADEQFEMRERIGASELEKRIRSGTLTFHELCNDRFDGFERDIEVLSVYLNDFVVGKEVFIRPTAGAPILKGWSIVGCRGETARVPLDLRWDGESIVEHGEDLDEVKKEWASMPDWLRNSLRLKHPNLSAL